MIPADLLDKLREKDPELWDKLQEQFEKLKAYQEDRVYEVDVIATFECLLQMSGWILQGLLQEAIRAHRPDYIGTWFYNLEYVEVGRIEAKIFNRAGIISEGVADTEAEALCRAYLDAIQTEDKT